jgi:asparagine synthase (glutamine-hydrolysing)
VLDRFEPLMNSQPLTELCLRIPTYVLTAEGCERFVARQAFGGALPAEIFNRITKGGPRDAIKQLLAQNREFIRTLLLDGILVSQRLIDRERLRDALSPQPTRIRCVGIEILKLLNTEAWLRRWSDQRQRAAA